MKITNFIASLALFLLIIGCATTAKFETKLDHWVGYHADQLAASWGPPNRSHTLSNGGSVFEYARTRNITMPLTTTYPTTTQHFGTIGSNPYSGYSTGYQSQTTYHTFNEYCIVRFTVAPNGIIQNWSWEGNSCKSD